MAKMNLDDIESQAYIDPKQRKKLERTAEHLEKEIQALKHKKIKIIRILDTKPTYNKTRTY